MHNYAAMITLTLSFQCSLRLVMRAILCSISSLANETAAPFYQCQNTMSLLNVLQTVQGTLRE
jgi:hypothetical protein